jgi:integrase
MASIRKRDGRPKPWEAVYRDPDGRQRTKAFARKVDARRFLATVEADVLRGTYVDPEAGRVTLETFARQWLDAQTFDAATREAVKSRLATHVYPYLGGYELRHLRPSTLQAWLAGLQRDLAPRYVRVILANVSSMLSAAVEDGLLAKNPARSPSVRAPRVDPGRVEPWPRDQVDAVIAAHPEPYRAVPMTAAGVGLRQGECFGLAVEDVDFLRRTVHVRRQVKLVGGKPIFAAPKGGRTRDVPLPNAVGVAVGEGLRQQPAREVTLPWKTLDGEAVTVPLVFTTREAGPLVRNHYNPNVWKPALRAAGVEPSRANGMHALRHYYASALLEAGVSIRAVADYLGHADAGFTLRTYAHLMPQAEDRARAAMDAVLGPGVSHMWANEGQTP